VVVSGQLNVPTTLPQIKNPRYPKSRRLGASPSRTRCIREELNNLSPLQGNEPHFLSCPTIFLFEIHTGTSCVRYWNLLSASPVQLLFHLLNNNAGLGHDRQRVEPWKVQLKLRVITSATERGKIKLGGMAKKRRGCFRQHSFVSGRSNIKERRIDCWYVMRRDKERRVQPVCLCSISNGREWNSEEVF
jgi:hypothetical protein